VVHTSTTLGSKPSAGSNPCLSGINVGDENGRKIKLLNPHLISNDWYHPSRNPLICKDYISECLPFAGILWVP
jgi:hypothetical protein